MGTQLSNGPIEITGLELHEINEAFRRIQEELDQLRGLKGPVVLQAAISAPNITNPTITTPTIADFTSANHNHQNAAGGGTLDHGAALTGLTDHDHTQYLKADGTNQVLGTLDLTALAAGGANFNVNLTSDTPTVTWGIAAGNEASTTPMGYLEIIIGGSTVGYIPVWA